MAKRGPDGRFLPGEVTNPRGRPPGPNKINREVREMVRQALDAEGGVEYLQWAARQQPQAFLSLLGRLIPAEIRASLDGEATVLILRDYSGVEFEQIAQREQLPIVELEPSPGREEPVAIPEVAVSPAVAPVPGGEDEILTVEVDELHTPTSPGSIRRPGMTERQLERERLRWGEGDDGVEI